MSRFVLALLVVLIAAPGAHADPWPPKEGRGDLFVHFGEEHWNDIDGEAVLTRVVAESARYRPLLVTLSGDKTDDGTAEQLQGWARIMAAYDRAGVPYLAAVGNHDGKQPTPEAVTHEAPGSTPLRDITEYLHVFASRPYPMGDAAPYRGIGPARPADDPAGASTHFHADSGGVRWIFVDSSCYGIVNCEPFQNPPDGRGRSQYQYLRDTAREAKAGGKVVFVVTHMPTRDPRDQDHSTTAQRNHVMGKGISPDNDQLEREAEALGVDAVFVAHIKGQWLYRGRGGIPYYIDGGGGGELYTAGPLGVDHGYWYGWRLIRVDGKRIETDAVPVIVPGGIRIEGPVELRAGGEPVRYDAFAEQPATKSHRGVVKALELRDPDPVPRATQQALVPVWVLWLLPIGLLPLLLLALRRPRLLRPAVGVAVLAVGSMGAVAGAQRSVPTSTPRDALPNPARMFTSGDAEVLAAVASESDDPRRDAATQTADGAFRPRCPGRMRLTVSSGFEEQSVTVVVRGPAHPVRTISRRRALRRGRRARVAAVRLRSSAIVEAKVLRGRRVVAALGRSCRAKGTHALRWTPRARGSYTLRIRAGRAVRSFRLTVR